MGGALCVDVFGAGSWSSGFPDVRIVICCPADGVDCQPCGPVKRCCYCTDKAPVGGHFDL